MGTSAPPKNFSLYPPLKESGPVSRMGDPVSRNGAQVSKKKRNVLFFLIVFLVGFLVKSVFSFVSSYFLIFFINSRLCSKCFSSIENDDLSLGSKCFLPITLSVRPSVRKEEIGCNKTAFVSICRLVNLVNLVNLDSFSQQS